MKKATLLFVLLAAVAAGARAQSKYITVEYKDGTKQTIERTDKYPQVLFQKQDDGTYILRYRLSGIKPNYMSLGELSTIKEVRRGIHSFNAYCDIVALRDGKHQSVTSSWQYVFEGDEEELLVWDDYEEEGVDWHESDGWVEWNWDSSVSDPQVVSIQPRRAGEWYTKVKFLKPASVVYIYAQDEKGGQLQVGYTVMAREFPEGMDIYDDDTYTTGSKEIILGEQQYVDFFLADPQPFSQNMVRWVQWTSSDESVATIEKTPEGIGSKTWIHARATIKGPGTTTITAQSPSGQAKLTFTLTVQLPITEEFFPDVVLRNYVSTNFDKDKNGYLSHEERESATRIAVSGPGVVSVGNLSSLKGIEYFPNLTALHCQNNRLSSIDVSKNTALKLLNCYNNKLTSLNISGCTALANLDCTHNQLTSLDISGCTSLANLDCTYNQLTSLDISGCTSLANLACTHNQLTSLNISGCTSLANLDCTHNQLTSLDVSNCSSLKDLYCYNNQLTSLNVGGCNELSELRCEENLLTSLDVSENTTLATLHCNSNQLTSLDVSNSSLNRLYCENNQLTSLDITNCNGLYEIDCAKNQLTSLDVRETPHINSAVKDGMRDTFDDGRYYYQKYDDSVGVNCRLYVDKDVNVITK